MRAEAVSPLNMEVTDSELMQCLAGGDDLALNALMQRWRERLASFLYKMTGNVESAADLTQETFVKLYQVRNRYRPDGKFSSFLFAIGVNLARNHARWKSRHPTISLDEARDDGSCILELRDTGLTPEDAAASAEKIKAVHGAFLVLPADLREAMTLFIYEDMSYAEISSVVGCSVKAAETRIYRARQILKEKLKDIRA